MRQSRSLLHQMCSIGGAAARARILPMRRGACGVGLALALVGSRATAQSAVMAAPRSSTAAAVDSTMSYPQLTLGEVIWRALAVSVGVTGLSYLLFNTLLKSPLPPMPFYWF